MIVPYSFISSAGFSRVNISNPNVNCGDTGNGAVVFGTANQKFLYAAPGANLTSPSSWVYSSAFGWFATHVNFANGNFFASGSEFNTLYLTDVANLNNWSLVNLPTNRTQGWYGGLSATSSNYLLYSNSNFNVPWCSSIHPPYSSNWQVTASAASSIAVTNDGTNFYSIQANGQIRSIAQAVVGSGSWSGSTNVGLPTHNYNKLKYLNGYFILLAGEIGVPNSSNRIFVSTTPMVNGSWSAITPPVGVDTKWMDVAYGNNKYIAVCRLNGSHPTVIECKGNPSIASNWKPVILPVQHEFSTVVFNSSSNQFVIAGSSSIFVGR